MDTLKELLISFHQDDEGATATEYIILLILIACFVIAIVKVFGQTASSKFQKANSAVTNQVKMS